MTALPKLPIWTLVDLQEKRMETAATIGGKLIDQMFDGAENASELVKASLLASESLPGRIGSAASSVAASAARVLAAPLERLSRARRVDLSVGNLICVRQAARFDLVELLQLAQKELNRPNLRLVSPGITFEEGKRSYSWKGLLIEFYAAPRGSGLHPHYVALDPEPDGSGPVRSTLSLTVVDTFMQ